MGDEIDLKIYVEALIKRERELRKLQFAAAQRAIDKAEASMTQRLEGMNEFRRQLERQENTYATRVEIGAVSERVNKLERAESVMSGKGAMLWLVIIVGLGLLGVLFKSFGDA